ncbi:MAG: hypothetical protein L0Y55_09485, partial [Anaerolineales bacterium]|nr:hypothetical protein [Anaerolineales bacterium]
MPNIQTPTFRELVKLALPIETRVLVERGLPERPITWIVSVPANDWARLAPGDFAFLLPPYPSNLATQVARLAQSDVAGIAI